MDTKTDARPAPAGASVAKDWLRALELTGKIAARPTHTLTHIVDEMAQRNGGAPALLSHDTCFDYRTLAGRAARYAHWALGENIAKGDVVALLMPNCPDYLAIWLGISRIGGVVALLNTHLTGPALAHCINIVNPKHVIVAASLTDAFASAQPHLAEGAKIWARGAGTHGWSRIDEVLERLPAEPPSADRHALVTIDDLALLIYTSGTTGLPKAANIDHGRLLMWSYWFAGLMNTRPDDRMYNCLPMYHSIGGVAAIGAVLVAGGSVFVRDKFSARQFWDDVVRWDCTLFQYIGELCRYLVKAAPHPLERAHQLRLACGNGLRLDVWEDFAARFRIPRILEFYASTEGNVTLFNVEGKPGAIGRAPSFLAHRLPAVLVKFDVATGAPLRDAGGLCVKCAVNEPGEALGRIGSGSGDIGRRFNGYTSAAETEKKILRDVFEPGDAWFRTGDLMRRDDKGFFYFVDRIGDTFRWKGENVATSEVAAALCAFDGIVDAAVTGVQIPGCDGKAGMAVLVADGPLDLTALHRHLAERLPSYARPLFVTIRRELDITSTFKHKKAAGLSYDPESNPDPIYFNDPDRDAFVRLDTERYQRICSGELRL
ncbi:MAG: long-chain-acyl-CoA synthetase [Hyphomicrobiales bacterium]|nr:long-chain-acyl-CoA synthetase [Hyphomicrobiales bacterium]MBV8826129.1 long-chain-acyl-CoA synthetase [Hyphomicrobiales bacterium]MBV9427918.1 long-chain-acyl-CoA synthetase [Bradyrhizobiaceae bacterium]